MVREGDVRAVLIGAILAAAAVAPPAASQTAAQLQALENLAMAYAFERECPSLALDKTVMATTLLGSGVEARDFADGGRFQSLLVVRMAQATTTMRHSGAGMACGMGRAMFGPAGINVRNLLVTR